MKKSSSEKQKREEAATQILLPGEPEGDSALIYCFVFLLISLYIFYEIF